MRIEVDSLTCLLRRKHLNLFILHGLQQTLQEWCRRQTPCRNSDVPWPRGERNVVSRLSRLEVELRSASHVLEEGRIRRLDQINLVSLQILVILQCDKETGIIDVCTKYRTTTGKHIGDERWIATFSSITGNATCCSLRWIVLTRFTVRLETVSIFDCCTVCASLVDQTKNSCINQWCIRAVCFGSSICMEYSTNGCDKTRSEQKHILARFSSIQDLVFRTCLNPSLVTTDVNASDVGTKALWREQWC